MVALLSLTLTYTVSNPLQSLCVFTLISLAAKRNISRAMVEVFVCVVFVYNVLYPFQLKRNTQITVYVNACNYVCKNYFHTRSVGKILSNVQLLSRHNLKI